jgi:hypothetical protein
MASHSHDKKVDNTAFDVEHARYNELFEQFKLLVIQNNKSQEELQFIKKAMLEKPVIATLTDEQCEKLGKAISYFLADQVKALVKDLKVPLVN